MAELCRRSLGPQRHQWVNSTDKGQKNWAHPVISDGRLYVRNQDTLLVYHSKAGAR